MYNVTLRCVRETIVAVSMSITYSELVFVALGIQHATLMLHIVIRGVSDSMIFFSHYLTKGTIFEKKIPDIKFVF